MKKLILMITLIAAINCEDIGFLQNSDYGRKILKEQQIVFRSSNSTIDLIINLNNFESNLIIDSQKLMKQYQLVQSNNIERKQAIKQKIFLSKYQMQNLVEEQAVVEKEKSFAQFIYESRKKLMQEENKFIPQMQAIRNDEIDKWNDLKIEIKKTRKIIEKMGDSFNQLIHFLEKKPDLIQNSGFMSNNQKGNDITKFEQICADIKSDLEYITIENPYTMILLSLKPLLKTENVAMIEEIPSLLNNLILAMESSLEEIEQVSDEREQLYNTEKLELKKDIDKRSVEYEQIRLIYERTQQQEAKLNNEITVLKGEIQNCHDEQESLQQEIEKYQQEYKNNLKKNLSNLEIVRKLKLLMNKDKNGYLEVLKQKANI